MASPTVQPAASSGLRVVSVDLRPGTRFHSRYEIKDPLGSGGMGEVYRAYDRVLDEEVAIKILRPHIAGDPLMAARFKSEIKLARRVHHKNVCGIHDYGEDQGLIFISMELVKGVDLKRVLREGGRLPPEKGYDVAVQIADGLQAVHEAGIVHRDLKASNVMIDSEGTVRLMDFGVAKRVGDETLTAAGHIVGTPEYMSPEQGEGKTADFRSDVYALGVLTYEVFSGRVPFRGDTPLSTILKHIHEAPAIEVHGIPDELRPVLRKALAKDPRARYDTAGQTSAALRAARDESRQRALTIGPAGATVIGARPAGRRRLEPWLLSTVVIAVGAGLFLKHQGSGPTSPRPDETPIAAHDARPTGSPPVPSLAPSVSEAAAAAPPTLAPREVASTPTPVTRPRASRPPSATPAAPSRVPPTPTPASPSPSGASVESVRPEPTVESSSASGLLQVVVRPWGTVSIDGEVVGDTPLDKIPLRAGAHRVRVRHPQFEVWEAQVTIREGQTERLVVDFPGRGVRRPR